MGPGALTIRVHRQVITMQGAAGAGDPECHCPVRHVGIETPRDLVGCDECGAVARVEDRRTVTVRDLSAAGVPVVMRWRKRSSSAGMRCVPTRHGPSSIRRSRPGRSFTDRARQWGFEQVGRHDRAIAPVAALLGVSWHTIMRQVTLRGTPSIDSKKQGNPKIGISLGNELTGATSSKLATGNREVKARV